jgi:hypothetical protein
MRRAEGFIIYAVGGVDNKDGKKRYTFYPNGKAAM